MPKTTPKQFWIGVAAIVITLLTHTGAIFWWASSLNAAVKENTRFRVSSGAIAATVQQNADWIEDNKTVPIAVAVVQSQIKVLNSNICELVGQLKEVNGELKRISQARSIASSRPSETGGG